MLLGSAAFLLLCNPTPVHAELTWTAISNNNTVPRLWSDAENWSDKLAPAADESAPITIRSSISGANYIIQYDRDQILRGGMYLTWGTSNAGLITLDLNGHALSFEGNSLRFDPASAHATSRTITTFKNGTVRFNSGADFLMTGSGTSSTGTNTSSYTVAFESTSVFDSTGLGSLSIADNNGNNNRQNMILDLSSAVMQADGSMGHLHLQSSVTVGYNRVASPTSDRDQIGALKVGVLSKMTVGTDLIIGRSMRTSAANTNATGTLAFSSLPEQGAVQLDVGRDLLIGVGAGAQGSVGNAPQVLHLRLGSDAVRGGMVAVGHKAAGAGPGNATGSFQAHGTLAGAIRELHIGHNQTATGGAVGSFDFRDAALETLDIEGAALIGVGNQAVGEVRFSGGTVSSQSLEVGVSNASERSLLDLNGTLWTVSQSVSIGSRGDVEIRVVNGAGGFSLESTEPLSLTIETGGALRVAFDALPAETILWGLRIQGDHLSLLTSYFDDGLLIGTGAFGASAIVFLEDGFTYFGLAPIPELSSILLSSIGALGLAFVGALRRRGIAATGLGMTLLSVPALGGSETIAIVGPDYAVKGVAKHVVTPLGKPTELFEEGAPAVADYKKYAALIFAERFNSANTPDEALWSTGDNLQAVSEYLEKGGTIVIIGVAYPRKTESATEKPRLLDKYDSILGFQYFPKVTLVNPVRPQPAGASWLPGSGEFNWVAPYTVTVGKLTTAEVLAAAADAKGEAHPFATRQKVGKGQLYWFGTSPFRLAREQGAESADLKEYAAFLQKALTGDAAP